MVGGVAPVPLGIDGDVGPEEGVSAAGAGAPLAESVPARQYVPMK